MPTSENQENHWKFSGVLEKDPEVYQGQNYKIVTLTIQQKSFNQKSQKEESISFAIKFFNAYHNLKRGDHVTAEGRFRQNSWADKTSGQARTKLEHLGSSLRVNSQATKEEKPDINAAGFNEFDNSSVPF